jgi:hypothetical protein
VLNVVEVAGTMHAATQFALNAIDVPTARKSLDSKHFATRKLNCLYWVCTDVGKINDIRSIVPSGQKHENTQVVLDASLGELCISVAALAHRKSAG